MKYLNSLPLRASLTLLFLINYGLAFANPLPTEESEQNQSVYVVPVKVIKGQGKISKTIELCDDSMEQSCQVFKDYQVRLNINSVDLSLLRSRIVNGNEFHTASADSGVDDIPLTISQMGLRGTYQITGISQNLEVFNRANFTSELVWDSSENQIEHLPLLEFGDAGSSVTLIWELSAPQSNTIQLIDNPNLNGEILPLNMTTTKNAVHYLLLFNSTDDLSSSIRLPEYPYSNKGSQDLTLSETLLAQMDDQHLSMTVDSVRSLNNSNLAVDVRAQCVNDNTNQVEPCEGSFGLALISVPDVCMQGLELEKGCQPSNIFRGSATDYFYSAEPTDSTVLYIAVGVGSVVALVVTGVAVAVVFTIACAKNKGCRRSTVEAPKRWVETARSAVAAVGERSVSELVDLYEKK